MAQVIVGDGLVVALQVVLGDTPIGKDEGMLRVEADGLVEVLNGLVVALQAVLGVAPMAKGDGMLRVQTDGFVVVGDGLGVTPCLTMRVSLLEPLVCRWRCLTPQEIFNPVHHGDTYLAGGANVSAHGGK